MTIKELYYNIKYRIKLLFTKDPKEKKSLIIAIALSTGNAKESVAQSMIQPIRDNIGTERVNRE